MSRNATRSTTATQAHFANVPGAQIPRSSFDRSYGYKTAFDAGNLIPFFLQEILPGDTMKLRTSFIARLATPIYPYMDNVFMDFHYFFVPNRLLWENWERFQGAQDDPGDSTDFLMPQLDAATHAAGFAENSIYDYMGLPTKIAAIPQARMPTALPLRAYNLIWNEWFRDQNLQNSIAVDKTDGPDTTDYVLKKRGRRKDYFTSALPWPQKGPSVSLNFSGTAPVWGIPTTDPLPQATGSLGGMRLQSYSGGTAQGGFGTMSLAGSASNLQPLYAKRGDSAGNWGFVSAQFGVIGPELGYQSGLYADLAAGVGNTINEIRQAFQLQRLFERDARGGTRYVESLLTRFGVTSPDFRLQRPEYLGGASVPVNVNPIAQTSETATTPQGTLSAFATARGSNGFGQSFVEHGYVLGFVSVRADQTYQQGMHRMWSRRTRYDFYEPVLAHLGEQTVLNKEIYCDGSASDEAVFGYQERWAEYRYMPSMVTGAFRSNAATPLDSWHLALDFETLPTLAGLVEEDPPIDRIIAVPSEPQFIFDCHFGLKHARALPTYSVPGLVDHF